MREPQFLKDLKRCELCEHRCRVNRLEVETWVCSKASIPTVASATLHPAPPESFTVFTSGCNFKCLNCQNWTISQHPDNEYKPRGYIDAKDKLWEHRILVIPKINENEIRYLSEFIADIDPSLSVCFLAFRPNFVLENHPGASRNLMEKCVHIAKDAGIQNVYWSGHTDLSGMAMSLENELKTKYRSEDAWLPASYAFHGGCQNHPRSCSDCSSNQSCPIKRYIPKTVT